MKLLSLDLLAYGPFTDQHLEFDGLGTDFHIILGNNEAGKSSSLRALCALLYGVPERTKDAFQHPNPKLLLGGRLRHSDGKELAFLRRKGRKDTVMGLDRRPIPDATLDRFLVGVDRARFQTMFGIDHDRLAQAAQELLRGSGNVGQSLVAASTGSTNFRKLLEGLERETAGLFKVRGSTPTINATLAKYKEVRRTVGELSKSSSKWDQQSRHVQKLKTSSQELADEKARLGTQLERLKRLHAALPELAQRRVLLDDLATLKHVVSLPTDAPDLRRAAQDALRRAQRTAERAEQKRVELTGRADSLRPPRSLLDHKPDIDAIYTELGSYQKAKEDATRHESRCMQFHADAQVLLHALGWDISTNDVEELRPRIDTLARVQVLAGRFEALDQAPARCAAELKQAQAALAQAEADLAGLDPVQDPEPLQRTIHRIRKRGDLEQKQRKAEQAYSDARVRAENARSALSGWQGTLDEVEALAVPSRETVDRFAEDFAELKRAAKSQAEAIRAGQQRLADQEEKLDTLRLSGDVPTEAELDQARERRSKGWQRVREAWQQGRDLGVVVPDFDDAQDLPSAYEQSVVAADEISDRLRREADRVARYAEIEASRARVRDELDAWQKEGDAATQATARLSREWSELWAPLDVVCLPPREMRDWLDRHEELVGLAQQLHLDRKELSTLSADIEHLRGEVSAVIEALGHPGLGSDETLEAALDRAQRLVDTVRETARRHQQLGSEIPQKREAVHRAQDAATRAEFEIAAWRTQWATSMEDLGLAQDALPAEAHAVINKRRELFDKVDEAKRARASLDRSRAEAQAFEGQLSDLLQVVAPDLLPRPAVYAVEALHQRLAVAEKDSATLLELRQQIDDLDNDLGSAKVDQRNASQDLAALCRKAGCDTADQLEGVERDSQHKREQQAALAKLESSLVEHGGGATIDELEAQAREIDADALPGSIEALGLKIEQSDSQRSDLDRQIGQEQAELKRIDGSDDAAAEAERAQGLLAEMRTNVDRYVRLRLASELLRQAIERYRQDNQAPLLKRASQLFSALTLGSFVELRADLDEKDEPVWTGQRPSGRRPSGEPLGVAGMSDGTVDQLYLSIRLAALERYLAAREPIPFVVDDILIRFDDQRSTAALGVLAELSRKTQVLFFTHHDRLVELALQLGDGRVAVHKLGVSADPG